MVGVVDVGGGTRGIYGAGVFDCCLDEGIAFDYFVGVSAGSANGISYLAGQRGRNLVFYNEYAFRKEYMSLHNLLRRGSYIDLDYIYSTLSNEDGEYPVDYDALMANPAGFEAVATDAETARPVYFRKDGIRRNDYSAMKASCCVPVVNKAYVIDGRGYYDGGLSDPIPFGRAFAAGCEKVVVVLTRPKGQLRSADKDRKLARLLKRKSPVIAEALENRGEVYNRSLMEARRLEQEGKVLIIAPDDIGGLKTLSQDHGQLEGLYRKGYEDAKAIPAFLAGD